jgi:hypothetical protein
MKLTTALDATKYNEARDRMIFEQLMESFVKRWAPDDKYEIAQFDSELHSLIRQVYQDAQKPLLLHLEKIMSAAVALAPGPLNLR